MAQDFYERLTCRMCDGRGLERVMRLTPTPPGNNLLRPDQVGQPEPCYPLELNFCGACRHVQLAHVVDPRILYQNNYSYVSGTSAHFVAHLRDYAAAMIERFGLPKGSLVADIGSNDGTCLRFFKDAGMRVHGVDPATEIAARATSAGIPTTGEFFSETLGQRLRDEHGPAAFITSHNACAHIDQLIDVVRGVSTWLADDGVFVLEVGYLADVYQGLHFDTIYHEHLDYHTVAPFRQLFARTDMSLLAVQRVAPQGGSIRVMAQKQGGRRRADDSVAGLIQYEEQLGLHHPATFSAFGEKIAALGARLRQLIGALKAEGRRIAAYGAPTKATTLLTHFGIGAESIDFVVDDNPLKQNLVLPLSHLPVRPTAELYSHRPDYALILAWNFATPIMAIHRRFADEGGRFILPMPEPRIV